MANIDSKITVNKDKKPFFSVFKAFFSLLEIYIFNLFLNKERDNLSFINYLISKAK